MAQIAIIGGTGLRALDASCEPEASTVETPWGRAQIERLVLGDRNVCFLSRHGPEGNVPPHKVNYRANIWALRERGCRAVVATNTVGSLNQDIAPGIFALLAQFLDFTKSRVSTFFDSGDEAALRQAQGRPLGHPERSRGAVHVDMTEPYCPRLRQALAQAAECAGLQLRDGAVYACTEGPRFETPAEIRMLAQCGADLVGMTGVPEVVLAREAQLCYASLCIVTNWAAGLAPTRLTAREVESMMEAQRDSLHAILREAVKLIDADTECACREPA